MPIARIIRWNVALIVAVGFYGLATNEPYWRDTGHGPWLYDYLFWFGLALDGPSGFAADYLSQLNSTSTEVRFVIQYVLWCLLLWPQWKLYHAIAMWSRESRRRQMALYSLALLVTVAGGAAAYKAWVYGHRPSDLFIDKYFWFVRIGRIACSGVVLLIYAYVINQPRFNPALEGGLPPAGAAQPEPLGFRIKTLFNVGRNILAVCGLAAILVFAEAWFSVSQYFWQEKEAEEFRLSSPNKEYDAVVTIQEPGAVGSSTVRLYVVPTGIPFDKRNQHYKFEVLRSNSVVVDKLKWRNDRTLIVIRGPQDQIRQFDPIRYDLRDVVPNQPVQEGWRRVTVLIQTDESS
jgi:hypothetical protein